MNYISFLLKSTNEHGVQSPFVFEFVTKCIYNKNGYKWENKVPEGLDISVSGWNRLCRVVQYFGAEEIVGSENFKNNVIRKFGKGDNGVKMTIFANGCECKNLSKMVEDAGNDDVFVVIGSNNDEIKEGLLRQERVSAIVDMYFMSLFFVRSEQRREIFYIRG